MCSLCEMSGVWSRQFCFLRFVGAYKAVCYARGLGFFVVFLSFGFLALFCFCFLQKGILDSKSVVLCKSLESKSY